MLTTPQGFDEIGKNSILHFSINSIEHAYEEAGLKGAQFERAPQLAATMPGHELWIGFLKDFDGNLVGMMEEKRNLSA